ncbi:DUF2306 domain-containing protein [Catelliglobosispora koreensis]|uniref:DUF2306 domain-containing protein n=1 Tax=Catelliglobosispora koreensis TaxID=129052 RepID=UPI000A022998|nr:DUF2306 domain-containing protein [Catelliglobosispora koreensis]
MKRLIPFSLLALGAVPIIFGAVRVAELAGGPDVTEANARFVGSPVPIVVHIVSVTIYSLLGAFQFAPDFRRRRPGWHRAAGRVLVPCGLLAALSGIWMTVFYALPATDSMAVNVMRLIFGSAMAAGIVLAVIAIRRRDIQTHRAWMIRAYAIGLGAGTQVFTHLPLAFVTGQQTITGLRTYAMGAGWLINIAVAEWIIRRPARLRTNRRASALRNPATRSTTIPG